MTAHPFLDRSVLHAALGDMPVAVYLYDTVDSTNTEAKRYADRDCGPALYIARTQTAGRGRLGRSFHSPADTGLYLTLSFPASRPLDESVRITALAAVAAAVAVETHTAVSPGIKWVNDLYLGGGKLAGILTESVIRPDGAARLIVGLGMNLTTTAFPEDLRAPAASLFAPSEAHCATPALIGALAGAFARHLLALESGRVSEVLPGDTDCLAYYRRHLCYIGERVICTRGDISFEGIVLGVNHDFDLQVQTEAGLMELHTGEISIRRRETH